MIHISLWRVLLLLLFFSSLPSITLMIYLVCCLCQTVVLFCLYLKGVDFVNDLSVCPAGASVPRLCQHSAWGTGFRVWWGARGCGGTGVVEAGGVRGDVAACPILHVPRPAECGLADLWEPINASPNDGKEERLSCNPYWLPCALSANLYHGFVQLNDVLLSSSPTLIHNIISFQYSPNYSSSDLNLNGMNEKNSNKQTNIYSQTWHGNNGVNSIDVIVKSLVLSSQNKCEIKHQTHRAVVWREKRRSYST